MFIIGKGGVYTMAKNKVSKYTEDWVPINSLINGMIVLDNGLRVAGVKVNPKNIFMLDNDSQTNVIIGLKNFYNTIDYEFWLSVADRPVDISLYLSQLQYLYNNVSRPKVRKLIMDDINKANMFMNNNVVDTEYFILFKEKNIDLIQKRIRQIITNLAACGLNAVPTSNDDMRVLIENFLNGGMNTEFGVVMPL